MHRHVQTSQSMRPLSRSELLLGGRVYALGVENPDKAGPSIGPITCCVGSSPPFLIEWNLVAGI